MRLRLRLSYAPVTGPLLRAWQRVPRRQELRNPRAYLRAGKLHRKLIDEGYTILAARYGRALHHLAESIEERKVPGVIVDCGVRNGGSTLLMSVAAPSREAWAFDSFEGLPEPRPEFDGEASTRFVGYAQGSEQKLLEGFRTYADVDRVRVARGWFDETFPRFVNEIDRIAMLHIDADWYESCLLALETFYDKLSPGGFVAVDDYKTWAGAKRAVDEFRQRRAITAELVASHYWMKPAAPAESGPPGCG